MKHKFGRNGGHLVSAPVHIAGDPVFNEADTAGNAVGVEKLQRFRLFCSSSICWTDFSASVDESGLQKVLCPHDAAILFFHFIVLFHNRILSFSRQNVRIRSKINKC